MTTYVTGRELKTYYNTATPTTPTWVEVVRIADESVDFDKDAAEIKNRESQWKRDRGNFNALTGSFTYHETKNAADTVFDALWDSYLNGTISEWAFMDGAIATSGNKGFRAGIEIMKMNKKRELDNISEWDVEFALAELLESGSLVEPSRYEVP